MISFQDKLIQIPSLLLCTTILCSSALAQNTARPDLEGTWSNASLTNLTRRAGLDTLVVTPEEARVIAVRAVLMKAMASTIPPL